MSIKILNGYCKNLTNLEQVWEPGAGHSSAQPHTGPGTGRAGARREPGSFVLGYFIDLWCRY